jgi:hypothetical protein
MNEANVDYGIEKIEMMPATADGSFPDFETATNKATIRLIVADSLSRDKEDDQETEIEVEDMDEVFLRLPGKKGKRTITFQIYDTSAQQYSYFLGYTKGTGDEMVETPGFVLQKQAMRLTTKAVDKYPAKVHTWAKVDVKVKETGNISKNGLPNLQFDITIVSNLGTDSKELPNHKWELKV